MALFVGDVDDSLEKRLNSCGKPFQELIRISNPENLVRCLVQIKRGNTDTGIFTFEGYYKDEETQNAMTDDGWYRSGDLGALDEDGIMYLGRWKDM